MAFTPEQLLGAKEWNTMIRTEVENALGSKLDGSFIAANYPAGFNYGIQPGTYYNADSLSALDTLLKESDGIPSIGGSYSELYKRVIGNLQFAISSADQMLINEEENQQQAMVAEIIRDYKDSGLDDDPMTYPKVMQIIARIKEVTGMEYNDPGIAFNYPNLAILCQQLSEYTRKAVMTSKLRNEWIEAYNRMDAIKDHIEHPEEANGGLMVDSKNAVIGWDKLPDTKMLLAQLQSGNKITFSMTAKNFSSSASDFHMENDVTVRLPFYWLFHAAAEHESEYDLSQYAGTESELAISITFNGITTMAAIPEALTADHKKGWFASDILNDAAAKSGKDATGYCLHGNEFDPATLFGKDGMLRRMKTFVISQQPTISLHFSKFDCSRLKEVFNETTVASFSFLGGLVSGDHVNGYQFTDYGYDEQKQTLDVTLTPAPLGSTGSLGSQTAFVLGGVAEYFEPKQGLSSGSLNSGTDNVVESTGFTCTKSKDFMYEEIRSYLPRGIYLTAIIATDYASTHFVANFTGEGITIEAADGYVSSGLSGHGNFHFDE